MCNYLNWASAAGVGLFAVLALIAWLMRGEGPRRPLLLLFVAAALAGVFDSFVAFDWSWVRYTNVLFLPVLFCAIGAPFVVGATCALARGARWFVLFVGLGIFAATPLFPSWVNEITQCSDVR